MQPSIHSLRQTALVTDRQLEAILDRASLEDRGLNADEAKEYDRLLATLNRNSLELSRAQETLERERRGGAVDVSTGSASRIDEAPFASFAPSQKVPRRYAEMFPDALERGGFQSLNDYLKTVHSGMGDNRLKALTGMGEEFPSGGGFLVPTEYSAQLLDVALEQEIVRPRAMVYPMKSSTRKIAGLADLDNSGKAPFGGLAIQWANEGATGTNVNAKTRLIQLTAQKGMIFTFASNELIADGMNFDDLLGSALIKSLSWGLDYAFLQGNGAGQPKGVLSDPALITIAKQSGQIAATLVYENVTAMFAALHPQCIANAVWVMNSTVIPQLLEMQLVVKNVAGTDNVGGSAVPVVKETDGKFTLLGRPIFFTEKLPALGSLGDVVLADFSQYAVGLRKEISLERSIYPGWQTDESAYRVIIRVDGQGRWNQAFLPANGNPLSWCGTLQARS